MLEDAVQGWLEVTGGREELELGRLMLGFFLQNQLLSQLFSSLQSGRIGAATHCWWTCYSSPKSVAIIFSIPIHGDRGATGAIGSVATTKSGRAQGNTEREQARCNRTKILPKMKS
jgi:hypothetical protein